MNWDAHWQETEPDDEQVAAGERMARRYERFFEPFPASLADVGCGPAITLFELADRHPEADLWGYDVAESIIDQNRKRAREYGADNLSFAVASLPELDLSRRFECVTCIATLHYLDAIEDAVQSLYDRVRPGGTLVFNYPNRHTRAVYRDDPDVDEDRFALLLAGENLLTYDRIEHVLGRRPKSFWKAVDVDGWPAVGRSNPCVYVEKPER